jgi:3-keto-L-gulonate-6-phosphate decarboxylase
MRDLQIQFANDYVKDHHPTRSTTLAAARKIFQQVEPFVDRLEVGTPLIKLGGIQVVTDIATSTPKPVVADMKTLDGGDIEVRMAARAGAAVVMVSAHASNATLDKAIKEAKLYGIELMVELDMELPNIYKKACETFAMGASSFEFHVGLDLQAKGRSPLTVRNLRLIRKLARLGLPLAVAGGIDPVKAYFLARETPVQTLVVGGWLYNAENPAQEAKILRDCLKVI